MTEDLRAFIAIELPQSVLDYIQTIQDALRAGRFSSIAWTRPQGIHLTLKFLGNILPDQVPQVVEAMESSARECGPLRLTTREIGAFPGMDRARVLWLGVHGDVRALTALQARLDGALAALGFPRETRPFSAHLTLGRVRDGMPPAERRRLGPLAASVRTDGGVSFDVTAVSLMRSMLTPTGAIYDRLAEAPLRGDASPRS